MNEAERELWLEQRRRIVDHVNAERAARVRAAEPVVMVDDATFMENVRDARENGYDRVCVTCGVGIADDGLEAHARGCPEHVEFVP